MNQSQAHDQELIRKAQNPREEITTLRADLARVTRERDRLLERNKTLAETAMRATARANGQEVEVEKSLIFIRDVLAEWNSAEADRDALRARVAKLEADNARLREAVGEVIRQYKCLDSQSWKSDPSPLHFAIAAAEAALKGDS